MVIIDSQIIGQNIDELLATITTDCELARISLMRLISNEKNTVVDGGFQKRTLRRPFRQSELYKCIAELLDVGSQKLHASDSQAHSALKDKTTQDSSGCILIVEDNLINQKVLRKMLLKRGFEVDTVTSGPEAIKTVQEKSYTHILMDCQMPEMDGFETTMHIRGLGGRFAHIPIIAVTAYALKGDDEKCLAFGMNAYVKKPIDIDELVATLNKWAKPKVNESTIATTSTHVEKSSAINHNVIKQLQAMSDENDPEFLADLVQLYLQSAPPVMAELKVAVVEKDATQIHHLAHRLKGFSANLGADGVVRVCEILENNGRANKLERCGELFGKLEEEFEKMKQELTDHYQSAA